LPEYRGSRRLVNQLPGKFEMRPPPPPGVSFFFPFFCPNDGRRIGASLFWSDAARIPKSAAGPAVGDVHRKDFGPQPTRVPSMAP
jgi:hypothetical protein